MLIFSKKQEFPKKLSDHLVFFCRNILIDRQLVVWRLSANCLDGLQMKGNSMVPIQDSRM